MRLPAASASYTARVRYGRYVARRLRRAKLTSLAEDALTATLALRTAGRALEDADDAIQDAMADRDAADDALDDVAKAARANLAGRSADAARTEPFTLIFPDGLAYYTAAPLDAEVARYGELHDRVSEHLPASDATRKAALKGVDAGLTDFKAAVAALTKASSAESILATKLRSLSDAWTRQMEKTYGAVVGEVGKAKAEAFFPRTRGKADAPVDEPPADPPAGG